MDLAGRGILVVLAAAAAVAVASGCGKDRDDKKVPSVKDHPNYVPFAERDFGQARIVNLYANPQTAPQTLGVWVETEFDEFSKLPASVDFGRATPWFRGSGAVLIPAGSGASGERVGSMMYVPAGRKMTFVKMGIGAHTGGRFTDVGEGMFPAPVPPPGKASILVYGKPLEAFGSEVERRFGTQYFYVGDGAGACRPSRENVMLGKDGQVVLDIDPGTVTLTLHADDDKCAGQPIRSFAVALQAGESAWAFVYTRDGTELEVLTLPVGRD